MTVDARDLGQLIVQADQIAEQADHPVDSMLDTAIDTMRSAQDIVEGRTDE